MKLPIDFTKPGLFMAEEFTSLHVTGIHFPTITYEPEGFIRARYHIAWTERIPYLSGWETIFVVKEDKWLQNHLIRKMDQYL